MAACILMVATVCCREPIFSRMLTGQVKFLTSDGLQFHDCVLFSQHISEQIVNYFSNLSHSLRYCQYRLQSALTPALSRGEREWE